MISKTNVLAVSLIAFMSICGARAEIASKAYVEQIVGAVTNTTLGAVPTSRTVNGNALTGDVTVTGAQVPVTGYAKADSVSAITTSDSVNVALGKLEKALDGKQASGSYAPALASQITAGASNSIVTYNADGLVTGGTAAGSLATLSAVGSTEITDGSIMNADINASAAIAMSKIDGLSTALTNAQNKIPSGSEGSSTLASIWVQ